MTDQNQKPSIAFFGATGGCTLSCLVPALKAGYRCTALVRNPSKLQTLLEQRNIPESTISANLTIIQGDITDSTTTGIDKVRQTLLVLPAPVPVYNDKQAQRTAHPADPDLVPVDMIISGIGGKPQFNNPLRPTLDNPRICRDGIRNILAAVRTLNCDDSSNSSSSSSNKERKGPVLVALSTTGISDEKRDVPLLMLPMYHWLLSVPHADKKAMEQLILDEMKQQQQPERSGKIGIRDYVIVRPSLLTDGEGYGVEGVRAGREEEPAVGYSISRNDVGNWMFERLVRDSATNAYLGQVVSITS